MQVETFPWESKEQKEGYLAFVSYLNKFGLQPESLATTSGLLTTFFIQKDHESNEYWRDLWAQQVSELTTQIHDLQVKLNQAHELLDLQREATKSHGITLDLLSKGLNSVPPVVNIEK